MKPFKLSQEFYKTDDGHEISAAEVDCITSYEYIMDGFYKWQCAGCGNIFSSRAVTNIAGLVLKCHDRRSNERMGDVKEFTPGCGKMNLLVKTNCEELDKCFGNSLELEREKKNLDRLKEIETQYFYLKEQLPAKILKDLFGDINIFIKEKLENYSKS